MNSPHQALQTLKEAPVRYNVRIDFNDEGHLRVFPVPNPLGKWVDAKEVDKLIQERDHWMHKAKILMGEE
jgi:hypothetical protein